MNTPAMREQENGGLRRRPATIVFKQKRGTIHHCPEGTSNTVVTAMQARTSGGRCTLIPLLLEKFRRFSGGSEVER